MVSLTKKFHATPLRGVLAIAAAALLGPGGGAAPAPNPPPTSAKSAAASARAGQPDARRAAENYQIVPNDYVLVEVFQEEDMKTYQRVAKDGTINLALVGRVPIAGLTVEGAAKVIETKLKDGFLLNPQVTVSVSNYAPRRFTMLGEVQRPGSYEIPSEEILTLPAAIAMAGGNTRIGNLGKVYVQREQNGKVVRIKLNAKDQRANQFVIKDGDTITVTETLF